VTHSTKWVEETLDLSAVRSSTAAAPEAAAPADDGDQPEPLVKRSAVVEVNGKRFSVDMWVPESHAVASGGGAGDKARTARKPRRAAGAGGGAAGSGSVTVPMQGTIVKLLVEVGQEVEAGQGVVVLEAMKMENQINAERAGTIKEIKVAAGDTVGGGDVVAVIE
jgi:acetyl-CoA/propionyl-CoA carboxylase biotin carboxyl carrier protein